MNKPRSGIYGILEELLKATKEPLTCNDLFENEGVRRYAKNPNRVSDYLGHMHRRGLLQRWTAPPQLNNKARFGYTWKEKGPVATPIPEKVRNLFKVSEQVTSEKTNVKVTEQGKRLTIEFENFIFTVESKA